MKCLELGVFTHLVILVVKTGTCVCFTGLRLSLWNIWEYVKTRRGKQDLVTGILRSFIGRFKLIQSISLSGIKV